MIFSLNDFERQAARIVPWHAAYDAERFRIDCVFEVIFQGGFASGRKWQLVVWVVFANVATRLVLRRMAWNPISREIGNAAGGSWGRPLGRVGIGATRSCVAFRTFR